jgi:hypothetical protein
MMRTSVAVRRARERLAELAAAADLLSDPDGRGLCPARRGAQRIEPAVQRATRDFGHYAFTGSELVTTFVDLVK